MGVRVSSLLTGPAHDHSTAQRPVQEQVSNATLLIEVQQRAEVQLSVAQRQAWVRVSVALDERRA